MARRKSQELDASSIADIAFLLLAFIIIATTLEKESGVQAFLPAKNNIENTVEIIDKNILEILVNKNNKLMIEGQWNKTPEDVKAAVIEFMENPNNSEDLPSMISVDRATCDINIQTLEDAIKVKTEAGESTKGLEKKLKKEQLKLKTVNLVGDYRTINKFATIAIQYDKATTYGTYLGVRDNIMSGLNKLRDDLALKAFGVTYKHLLGVRLESLTEQEQEEHKAKIKAIREVYPQKIMKLPQTQS